MQKLSDTQRKAQVLSIRLTELELRDIEQLATELETTKGDFVYQLLVWAIQRNKRGKFSKPWLPRSDDGTSV